MSLESEIVKSGNYSMKYDYDLTGAGYCGVTKRLDEADWTGFDGIKFNIYSDGSDRETTIQFIDGAGAYWESIQKVTAEKGWQEVKIPFSDFKLQSWGTSASEITLANVNQISIYAGTNGKPGKGTWYFDDLGLYADMIKEKPTAAPLSAEYNNDDIVYYNSKRIFTRRI